MTKTSLMPPEACEENRRTALALAKLGFPVFPASLTWNEQRQKWDKQPLVKWKDDATTDTGMVAKFWKDFPYAVPGIHLAPTGLVVVDADQHPGCPDGVKALAALSIAMPAHPIIQTASGGFHHIFTQPNGEPLGQARGSLPEGIDVRGDGGWIVAPGTVCPDGARYQIQPGIKLSDAFKAGTIPALPDELAALIQKPKLKGNANGHASQPFGHTDLKRGQQWAAKALHDIALDLARMGDGQHRNDALNSAAFRMGTMIARGWIDRAEVERHLRATCDSNGYTATDGQRAMESTLQSGIDGGLKHPHPDLPDRPAPSGASRDKSNGTSADGAASADEAFTWEEPDDSILDESRGELPEFPLDALSPEFQEWAKRNATTAGTRADHVVVPLLGIAGGLIGCARTIEAKEAWAPPCAAWYAIVGESGTGKTPGLDASRKPLAKFEYDRRGQIDEKRREHERKQKESEFALEAWEEACETAAETGQPLPAKPAEANKLDPFMEPMLAINDPTIEALAKRLRVQERGLLFIRDELAGLFVNMGRYSNGGDDRPFWLEAWNGGPYSVDRASKPAIRIPHLLVGIVGGFQPDKVARAFRGDEDGFDARMLMAWPLPSDQPLTREGQTFDPVTTNVIKALVALDDVGPAVRLTDEAWEIFCNFRISCMRQKESIEGRPKQWLAKAPDHALRIAGTLTFVEWAMRDAAVRGAAPTEVTADTMARAARLVGDYFRPHTMAALRLISATSKQSQDREVLKWIAANGLEEISAKDIRRDCLKQAIDNKATIALLERLTKAGWLREVTEPTGKRGRTARRWQVNPTLLS